MIENGKTVLNVKLSKALCSTLKAAASFYKKVAKDTQENGFELDPAMASALDTRAAPLSFLSANNGQDAVY